MRIRTIKPEFWESESNGRLSRDARLVFMGTLNLADDSGRIGGNARRLAAAILPYDPDGFEVMARALDELEAAGKITRYVVDGDNFVHIKNFNKHQKIDKRQVSRLPPPPNPADSPPIPPDSTLADQVSGIREQVSGNSISASGAAAENSPKPKRKIPETDFHQTVEALCGAYEAEVGGKYLFSGAKDAAAVKELLNNFKPEEILERWRKGLRSEGFYRVTSIAELRSKFNGLATQKPTAKRDSLGGYVRA